MGKFRDLLNKIEALIESHGCADMGQLKSFWNELSEAINEQEKEPSPLIKYMLRDPDNYPRIIISDSQRYKNDRGEISLLTPCMATMDQYEIYCISGDLFEGTPRFCTLEEAESEIIKYLEGK